jgi:hypothetical protein
MMYAGPNAHPKSPRSGGYIQSHHHSNTTPTQLDYRGLSHQPRQRHHHRRPRSPSRSRSRSRSRSHGSSESMSLDDMILQMTEGGDQPQHPQQQQQRHTSRGRRSSHEPYHYSRVEGYPMTNAPTTTAMTATTTTHDSSQPPSQQHFSSRARLGPPTPQPTTYTAPTTPEVVSSPGSGGGGGGGGGGTLQTYQTHIFAPPVTGAPVKKSKYSLGGSGSIGSLFPA